MLEPTQLLQLVLDTIPQKVFWKDLDCVYLGCNRLFAKDAGLSSPDEIVGKTDFDLPWTQEEAEFYRTCDQRVMEQNQAEIGIVEPQRNSDGDSTYLETNKVPLCDSSGAVIGMLGTYHDITKIKEAEHTLQDAHDLLERRVKDRTHELRFLAEHDPLTLLLNRKSFTQQLDSVIESGDPFGIMFIDVDRFKTVNDSMGHEAGDQILIQVSKVLKNAVRGSDTVGRFGGDEFTVLVRDIAHESELVHMSKRIQKALSQSIMLENSQFVVSASIGILTDFVGYYQSAGDMLRDSDIAMYEAKRAGRGCHRTFSSEMLESVRKKHDLEQQIRQALLDHEFLNFYQPILDIESGRLCGFESLARWQSASRGLIPPGDFLPLAEENGLIIEIGEQLILQACAQLRDWHADYPTRSDLSLGINLSIKQLLTDGFLDFLESALNQFELEPIHINIEITESMMLDKLSAAKSVLEQLSSRGHKVMLDDFGTGYSSLSYLHDFPIDTLKIDQSFVRNIADNHNSQAIVKTVLGLAKLLDMGAIAEGVETLAEEDVLRELGCYEVQGYRYAEPMPAEQARRFIGGYVRA